MTQRCLPLPLILPGRDGGGEGEGDYFSPCILEKVSLGLGWDWEGRRGSEECQDF